jgi:hypothetical protein
MIRQAMGSFAAHGRFAGAGTAGFSGVYKPPPGVADDTGRLLDAMRDVGEASTARQAGGVGRSQGRSSPSLRATSRASRTVWPEMTAGRGGLLDISAVPGIISLIQPAER